MTNDCSKHGAMSYVIQNVYCHALPSRQVDPLEFKANPHHWSTQTDCGRCCSSGVSSDWREAVLSRRALGSTLSSRSLYAVWKLSLFNQMKWTLRSSLSQHYKSRHWYELMQFQVIRLIRKMDKIHVCVRIERQCGRLMPNPLWRNAAPHCKILGISWFTAGGLTQLWKT